MYLPEMIVLNIPKEKFRILLHQT